MRIFRTILAGLLLVILLVSVGCSGDSSVPAPVPGNKAPDFSLKTLGGQEVSLSSYLGKPVMLNFWATWCGPCKTEIPHFQDIYTDPDWQERGLNLLAVNIGETPFEVSRFAGSYGITFPVLLDTKTDVSRIYNVSGIPVTYFIDEDGIINHVKIGAFVSQTALEEVLFSTIFSESS